MDLGHRKFRLVLRSSESELIVLVHHILPLVFEVHSNYVITLPRMQYSLFV